MTRDELREVLSEALTTDPKDFERDIVWEHIRKTDWDELIQEVYENQFEICGGHLAAAEMMTACYLAGIQLGWLLAKYLEKTNWTP